MSHKKKPYVSDLSSKSLGRQLVKVEGAKLVTKTISKAAGKTVARTAANPALLIADGVELGTMVVCDVLDVDEGTAKVVSKGAGLGSSVAIGAAVGGPMGALAGAAVWGVGELIGSMFG